MSSYNADTTAGQIAADCHAQIDNKTVLITGGSAGLGAAFATVIAKHEPACIILAARSIDSAQATADEIVEISPATRTHRVRLDLTSLAQVRAAADEILELGEKLDVIVNNAGIMAVPDYSRTEDGIERHFALNHVGHFLLTNLLLTGGWSEEPRKIRVVNVASDGYRLGPVRFEDHAFDNGKTYNRWLAYAQSKSANMLFSRALASRLGSRGLTAVSLHPGYIATELTAHLEPGDFAEVGLLDRAQGHASYWDPSSHDYKDMPRGIATHVFAAFHPSLDTPENNGSFLADSQVVDVKRIHSWGRDLVDADKLWELSEALVQETFLS